MFASPQSQNWPPVPETVAFRDVQPLDSGLVRVLIESALAYAGGTHTVADVEDAITRGDAQL